MDFGEPSGGGFIDSHFDFKQCQRRDGSIYGVPDKSSCAQKGAKEVKGKVAEIDTKDRNRMKASYLEFFKQQGETPANAKQKAYLTAAINALKDTGTITEEMRVKLVKEVVDKKGEPSNEIKQKVTKLLRDYSSARNHRDKGVKAKPVPKPKAQKTETKSKPKTKAWRSASKSEVLAEYRNNLANGKWTLKQQSASKAAKEQAQRDAVNQLIREGYDPRKIQDIFPSIKKYM